MREFILYSRLGRTDSKLGTPYVEMVAVMAKYNPFGEKAGMKKITEQEPQREILRVSRVLQEVGFNVQLLGSGNYILQKLKELDNEDLERVREAFIKADHPRFSKFFSSGLPFGHMGDYERKVNAATLEQLAGLIKICGFLMQTKVTFSGKAAQHHQYAKEPIRKSILNHNSNNYTRDLECLQ